MNSLNELIKLLPLLLIPACAGCQIANQSEMLSDNTESAFVPLSDRTYQLFVDLTDNKLNGNLYPLFRLFGNEGYDFWYCSSGKYTAKLSSHNNSIFVSGPSGYVREIAGLISTIEKNPGLVAEDFDFTTPASEKYISLCKRLGLLRRANVN